MSHVEEVAYDELCTVVDLVDLPSASDDAIAYLSPAATCHPEIPLDYGGVIGPRPEALTRSAHARYPESWWTESFRSPPLYAALLHEVLCFGGLPFRKHLTEHTLLARGRFVVPDSYLVRDTSRSLPAELITRAGGTASRALSINRDVRGVETQPGLYYFVGAAWDQFGHFILEGLSRLWLLARLPLRLRATLRFVLYNDEPLEPWQLELLAGLGVSSDRMVYLTAPMRFERLLIPASAYNLHREAAPAQAETWEAIGRAFDRGESPERVYLSRSRYAYRRKLLNEIEVEQRFMARGFVVLHPQELSIAEQLAHIRNARMIAGSVGSAMYMSAFAHPGAEKLIISPRYFVFRDDQLIAHLRDQRLTYVVCAREADPANPRMADYEVAPDILELAIDRWLAGDR